MTFQLNYYSVKYNNIEIMSLTVKTLRVNDTL